jgi:uncharacterized membrane protein
MRRLFYIVFLANLLLVAVSYAIMPDRVAIHFGKDGLPNAWDTRAANALIFLAMLVPTFVLFMAVPSMVTKFPPRLVSLPNKEVWLAEENKPRTEAMLTQLMSEFGSALFAFFFCMGLLVLDANLAEPVQLNERLFLVIFSAFILFMLYWCVKVFRAFRRPAAGAAPTAS